LNFLSDSESAILFFKTAGFNRSPAFSGSLKTGQMNVHIGRAQHEECLERRTLPLLAHQ
jgi:hypothetical protein